MKSLFTTLITGILVMYVASTSKAQTLEKIEFPRPDSTFKYQKADKVFSLLIKREVLPGKSFNVELELADSVSWSIKSAQLESQINLSKNQIEAIDFNLKQNENLQYSFIHQYDPDTTFILESDTFKVSAVKYDVSLFTKKIYGPEDVIYKGEVELSNKFYEIHFLNNPGHFKILVKLFSEDQESASEFKLKSLDNTFDEFIEKLRAAFISSEVGVALSLIESNESKFHQEAAREYFNAALNYRIPKQTKLIAGYLDIADSADSYVVPNTYEKARKYYSILTNDSPTKGDHPDTLPKKDFMFWKLEKTDKISKPVMDHLKESHAFTRRLRIDSVETEFYEGNIRNMVVYGLLKNEDGSHKQVIYHNQSPIPFTEFTDFRKLQDRYLVAFHGDQFRIKVGEFLNYYPKLHLNTDDYSPKDTVVMMKKSTTSFPVMLTKDNNKSILEGRIYSDFVGFKDDQPNGIIQTEVNKKVILNPTKSWRLPRIGRLYLPNYHRHIWYGFFNFVEPGITLSKLEENNRNLSVSSYTLTDTIGFTSELNTSIVGVDTIVTSDTTYQVEQGGFVKPMDVIRNANFISSIRLNILNGDIRRLKSSGEVNFGFSYYRTALKDSIEAINTGSNVAKEYNLSTLAYFIEMVWRLRPDPRYGFDFRFKNHWLDFKNGDLAVFKDDESLEADDKYTFWTIEMNAELRLGKNNTSRNRMFFRTRYSAIPKYEGEHFFQAQVGYAFCVIK